MTFLAIVKVALVIPYASFDTIDEHPRLNTFLPQRIILRILTYSYWTKLNIKEKVQ